MFGFLRDYIAFFPLPSWPLFGVYAALAAVLPFRLRDARAVKGGPGASHTDDLEQELHHLCQVANTPVVKDESAAVAPDLAETIDLGVVMAPTANHQRKIQRSKLGLKGRPLAAFRQAPCQKKKSKTQQEKRAVYQPRSKINRNQRVMPKTRVVSQTPKNRVAAVICLQLARPRPTRGLRLSHAA